MRKFSRSKTLFLFCYKIAKEKQFETSLCLNWFSRRNLPPKLSVVVVISCIPTYNSHQAEIATLKPTQYNSSKKTTLTRSADIFEFVVRFCVSRESKRKILLSENWSFVYFHSLGLREIMREKYRSLDIFLLIIFCWFVNWWFKLSNPTFDLLKL